MQEREVKIVSGTDAEAEVRMNFNPRKRWSNSLLLKHRGLIRRIDIKVMVPGTGYQRTLHFRPHEKGQAFNQEGIDNVLKHVSDKLDNNMPELDFRLVELGPGRFNLIGDSRGEATGKAEATGTGVGGRGCPAGTDSVPVRTDERSSTDSMAEGDSAGIEETSAT